MFVDLNVPFSPSGFNFNTQQIGKQKQKQKQKATVSTLDVPSVPNLTANDLNSINSRLDMIAHLGYTVAALNYTVHSKIDPATHVNPLLGVPPRKDILILRRLTIILDEASERGFGLSTQYAAQLASYDIIALQPTTTNTFSMACLTHTQPSPTTAHIISIDASSASPQLPFRMKLSMVRTAVRNGGVFEISYTGALALDESARRNWWSGAREIVRATKGKGLLLSGGAQALADLRAPLDAINLASVLGLDQNTARNAMSTDAKSLVTRASTRQTYRAVLSAPLLINAAVKPDSAMNVTASVLAQPTPNSSTKRIREVEDPTSHDSGAGEAPQRQRPPKRSKGRDAP